MNKRWTKRMKELKTESMTAGKLIKILETVHPDTLIGRVGHFGEACIAYENRVSIIETYVTLNGYWRDENIKEVKIVEIDVPELGPDPD